MNHMQKTITEKCLLNSYGNGLNMYLLDTITSYFSNLILNIKMYNYTFHNCIDFRLNYHSIIINVVISHRLIVLVYM